MARTSNVPTRTPTAANATNGFAPGPAPAGTAGGDNPGLHLRSFVAGAVLALLLAGAATLALRWTPAPAIVLYAPPTAQPPAQPATQAAAQPVAQPTVAARPIALPTPTVAPATGPAPGAVPAPMPAPMPAPEGAARSGTVLADSVPAVHNTLINLNTATAAELEALPGIGPAKAQAIIAHRPYNTVDDLDGVPGIGPATLERLRPLVAVN